MDERVDDSLIKEELLFVNRMEGIRESLDIS